MLLNFEPPPRMISWRNVGFSPSRKNWLLLLSRRSLSDLLKSQSSIFMDHDQGPVDSILDHHLGGLDHLLNLIELSVMSHRKVIS